MQVAAMGSDRRLVHLVDRTRSAAAEKMRVDFVANASHELRTPPASLLGFIEKLEDDAGAAPALRARFLGAMAGEAQLGGGAWGGRGWTVGEILGVAGA